MHIKRTAWAAALAALLAVAPKAAAGDDFLNGRVHHLDRDGRGLSELWADAARLFREERDGDLFFTGHVFLSRHTMHMGDHRERAGVYRVEVSTDRIKVRRESRRDSGITWRTESDDAGPSGVLLLHRLTDSGSEIVDVHLLDLEGGFTFERQPVYWMGEADNPDSLARMIEAFESSGERLQDRLLFIIGAHVDPEAGVFLRNVALSDHAFKVRKSAIFWIGNRKDASSLDDLKQIFEKVREAGLREQVVFALHISDDERSPREMVRIARTAESRKVRKSAVFWLGQKVSEESVGFLKGLVDSGEDSELKDAAVFAISQLPAERSVPMLIDIAQTNRSASVRKKAIFWLGQSGSEQALEFFEEILFKKD